MTEMTLFKRWTVKKKTFWLVIGLGIPALCILAFLGVAFFSPSMGGVYSAADYYESDGFAVAGEPAMDMPSEAAFDEEMGMAAEKALAPMAQSMPSDTTVANSSGPVVTERLIIREGNITVAVEDVLKTRDQIDGIVAELARDGAYVVTSSESGRGENRQPYINMVIRVPVDSFSQVMDQIAEMGVRVDERWENAQDVTDEYVDVEGRIEAAELSIKRLKELMADAEFTEDLLYAEEQLSRREAELEALKGRLNYLGQSAALSRININISPYELSEPIDTSWKPAVTFRRAVESLVDGMQGTADFLIVFAIAVLPFLLILGLFVWAVVAIVRAVRRRRKNKKAQATQE